MSSRLDFGQAAVVLIKFSLRQVLEQHHIHQRLRISIFLDLKGAFHSVDRSTLYNVLERNSAQLKYENILGASYAHTTGKVRVYGQLSQSRYFQRCTARLSDLPISFQLCDE